MKKSSSSRSGQSSGPRRARRSRPKREPGRVATCKADAGAQSRGRVMPSDYMLVRFNGTYVLTRASELHRYLNSNVRGFTFLSYFRNFHNGLEALKARRPMP